RKIWYRILQQGGLVVRAIGIKKRFLFSLFAFLLVVILANMFILNVESLFLRIILFAALSGAFLFFINYFMDRYILKPIIELNALAREIAENNLSGSVEFTTKDEFYELGDNINKMLINLRQILQENLESAEKVAQAA